MKVIRALLSMIFRKDPQLSDATERTDRIAAVVNGDTQWMLTCRPKIEVDTIQCDDGNTYKREES